jgi:TatD DNase family protein
MDIQNKKVFHIIDVHCHLEQKDYDKDRDKVVEECRKAGLKAIITSCARPGDFDLTMQMVEKHNGFVFATCGIHPEFIKEIKPAEADDFLERIKENRDRIAGIGEVGLDYAWVKEPEWRRKQAELFAQLIGFAKELKKPLVIHSRDAYEDSLKILEQEDAGRAVMHMFGANHLVKRVIENGYSVSLNAIVLRSKKHRKVARDMPLERMMLETDAPWLHPEGKGRNDPRAIKVVAEKIAEIKRLEFSEVWEQCAKNAIEFFNLPVKI